MKSMPTDIGTLHFVGIGGIGMSGIAGSVAFAGLRCAGL